MKENENISKEFYWYNDDAAMNVLYICSYNNLKPFVLFKPTNFSLL